MILEARNISFDMEKKQGNFKRFQSESREYRAGRACGAKRIWKNNLCKILSGYEKPTADRFCWTESLLISMAPTVRFS